MIALTAELKTLWSDYDHLPYSQITNAVCPGFEKYKTITAFDVEAYTQFCKEHKVPWFKITKHSKDVYLFESDMYYTMGRFPIHSEEYENARDTISLLTHAIFGTHVRWGNICKRETGSPGAWSMIYCNSLKNVRFLAKHFIYVYLKVLDLKIEDYA